jgi:hypothetical protein
MAELQLNNPFARPDNALKKLWQLYIDTLQADPWLSSGVKTWQVWSGDDADSQPWALEMCPILRVTPTAGTWRWADEQRHEGTIVLECDMGIQTQNVLFLWDFWECIHKSLFPPNNDLLNASLPIGGIQKISEGPALNPKLFANQMGLGATARVVLNCWINS